MKGCFIFFLIHNTNTCSKDNISFSVPRIQEQRRSSFFSANRALLPPG